MCHWGLIYVYYVALGGQQLLQCAETLRYLAEGAEGRCPHLSGLTSHQVVLIVCPGTLSNTPTAHHPYCCSAQKLLELSAPPGHLPSCLIITCFSVVRLGT